VCAAALLASCATTPPAPSRSEREALSLHQRAARAFHQGQLPQARSLFEEALRVDVSVENAHGIGANLLSLARVEQASGNPAAAHALLDRVLSDAPLALPRAHHAEAAARKAQIFLAARETGRAGEWAERAERLCASVPVCSARASALNLRALAALESRDFAAAADFAQRAVAAASGEEGRTERANGLRVAGQAGLARGELASAREALREALALDQALGLAPRIFRDLMLLGEVSEKAGQREDARTYYARALAVSAAEGDRSAETQARAQLERF
jgi:tetratricopeptide (TPR) repeat protein